MCIFWRLLCSVKMFRPDINVMDDWELKPISYLSILSSLLLSVSTFSLFVTTIVDTSAPVLNRQKAHEVLPIHPSVSVR